MTTTRERAKKTEQVSKAEVLEFLEAQEPGTAIKLDGLESLDMDLINAPVQEKWETVKPENPIVHKPGNLFNSTNKGEAETLQLAIQEDDIGEVTISEMDKDIYYKSLLFDEPLELTIQFPIGYTPFSVKLHTINMWDWDTVLVALRHDRKDGVFDPDSPTAFFSQAQYYICIIQISEVNGKSFSNFRFDYTKDTYSNAMSLRDAAQTMTRSVQYPKWRLLQRAVRIFEKKQVILYNHTEDTSFWKPAGSV
jgi:hypothetical protein